MDESPSDIIVPASGKPDRGDRLERILASRIGKQAEAEARAKEEAAREAEKAREEAEAQEEAEGEERISDEELFRDPDELDTIRDLTISLWMAVKKSNKIWLSLGVILVVIGLILNLFYWDFIGESPRELLEDRDGEDKYFLDHEIGDTGTMEGKINSIEYLPDLDGDFFLTRDTQLKAGGLSELLANETLTPELVYADRIDLDKRSIGNLSLESGVFNRVEYTNSRFTNMSFTSVLFLNSDFENLSFFDSTFDNVIFADTDLVKIHFYNTTFTNVSFENSKLEVVLIDECRFESTDFIDTPLKLSYIRETSMMDVMFTSTSEEEVLVHDMLTFHNVTFEEATLNNVKFTNVVDSNLLELANGYTFMRVDGLTLMVPGNQTDRFREDVYIWAEWEVVSHGETTWVSPVLNFSYFDHTVMEAHPDKVDLTLKQTAVFSVMMLIGGAVLVFAIGGHLIMMAMVKFFTPFIVGFAGIGLLFFTLNQGTFLNLARWMVLYFLPPLGKESVIPAAITIDGLDWWLVALTIAFIDIVVGLFLAWNFDIAKRIPLIGAFIRRLEKKGASLMDDKTWVEKFTFLGIVLFVVVPFQGSGAVGGTIMGRALGMKPAKVWSAVIMGALIGCFAIAFAVHQGLDVASEVGYLNFILLLMALVVIGGLVWIFKHWEEVQDEMGTLWTDISDRISFESATSFTKSINLDSLRRLSGGGDEETGETGDTEDKQE